MRCGRHGPETARSARRQIDGLNRTTSPPKSTPIQTTSGRSNTGFYHKAREAMSINRVRAFLFVVQYYKLENVALRRHLIRLASAPFISSRLATLNFGLVRFPCATRGKHNAECTKDG